MIVIACSITLAIAMLLLRNLSAIIITSTGHMFGILWTSGAMGWIGIELTMLGIAVPPLLTAIGFAAALVGDLLIPPALLLVSFGRKHPEHTPKVME